jgi:sugar-specific transcriptional regulator TrmB
MVERKIKTPTEFSAVPIQDVFSMLMRRRKEKTSELQTLSKRIIHNLEAEKNSETQTQNDETRLLLIPEGEAFIIRIKKCIENAKESIDVIASSKVLPQGMFFLIESLEKAMKRNVNIRIMTDKIEKAGSENSNISKVCPTSELKIIPEHRDVRFCVYDKKEITVVLSSEKDFGKSCLLWSDCPSLAKTYQDYYEMMWHTAHYSIQRQNSPRTEETRTVAKF